ncbi:homeobox-leucine zipper ATHB-20-like [Olea europaea subsp. europaea]|uniref:Homeobox-leucine zipper ATHB-20-like n=1 Tax=Olea europaea subsp. europaea TaxID=158383 RepID=A0A8S0PIQ5_OLEEU|nr:homeobox-leucine zipper ATHB-20-like [Olea europaea subsp. europaea]
MVNRFEEYQIDALKSAFEQSQHLTKNKKIELVTATGLDVEQITSWFNRNRAQKRARKSIGDLELTKAELRQALQALREGREREAELQKELQAREKKEAELRAENQDLKHQLAIVGGDSQFDYFLWSSHGPGSTQSNNLPRS